MMNRASRSQLRRKTAPVLIWICSAALFFVVFRMAARNSQSFNQAGVDNLVLAERLSLYDKMTKDLEEKGPEFLHSGSTSQSLTLSDIFSLKDGVVVPKLKPAEPPVRANVLYLKPEYAEPISNVVKNAFLPIFDKVIWFQNTSVYHLSMFHASHHIVPIPATENEIEDESKAVKAVAARLCPLKITLDRVILTSTGVLLGLWQVLVTSGTDPAIIRAELRKALPRAPEKQLYDPILLHSSFARLLGPPDISSRDVTALLHQQVRTVNEKLRGYEGLNLKVGTVRNSASDV